MATVSFADASARIVKDVSTADSHVAKIIADKSSAKISPIEMSLKKVDQVGYPIVKPLSNAESIKVKEILPFRVSFTALIVEGYTAKRPAPVGIAIVGINNYIL